jgi:hypothetical protein
LKAAEKKFSAFLVSQNYPGKILWVAPGDVLVDNKRHFWIRVRPEATERAALRYAEGVDSKLGIQLCAICATDTETVAFVFVPKDDVDAQYHLMGYGLKCACPVERYSTSAVRNRLKWLILCLRNRQPEHRVQHLFE